MPPWSLISPASRGIGFSLARRVLETTNVPVVATTRKDLAGTKERLLDGLGVDPKRLTLLELDVLGTCYLKTLSSKRTSTHSYTRRVIYIDRCPTMQRLLSHGVPPPTPILPDTRHLIPEKSPTQINADDALLTFRTNTLGPMLMLKHFSPFLPKKKSTTNPSSASDDEAYKGLPASSVTAVMSARVGSITDNRLGGWYSYRASKAAVNQVVKTFDNHLQTASGENAMAVGLHPGTVKTEFSKEFWGGVKKEKLFEPEWVAERLVEVVRDVGVKGRGRCWDFEGKEVPP